LSFIETSCFQINRPPWPKLCELDAQEDGAYSLKRPETPRSDSVHPCNGVSQKGRRNDVQRP
jgi:hypothetical protein